MNTREEGIPADASSLIYLAKADAFQVLVPVVRRLLIPPTVWFEAVEEGRRVGAPEVPRISRAEEVGLVERIPLDASERARARRFREQGLGRGESEVLAVGARTRIVVIDEGRGSRVARARRIEPLSTLGLVVLAFREGNMDEGSARTLARDLAKVMNISAEALTAVERGLTR